jgi:type III restriction enzyme
VLKFNTLDKSKLDPKIVIEYGTFVITKFTITLMEIFDGQARIRMTRESTENQLMPDEFIQLYKDGDDLKRKLNDERLRGYRIDEIGGEGESGYVVFENDQKLYVGESVSFESEQGQKPVRRTEDAPAGNGKIFNLIDRAAKATGLTRKTIHEVWTQVDKEAKKLFLKNPEGFANEFIHAIKETTANHLVNHLEFSIDLGNRFEGAIDEYFPMEKDFPQKELIRGGDAGMYDMIQVDSIIEENFVRNHLSGNDDKVIGYFKFPAAYRVDLPRMIGNYNPDWGILRWNEEGQVVLRLVRETKGRENPDELRFSNEGRKIAAAQKHFDAIHVDYRMVTDQTTEWYKSSDYRAIMEPRLPYGEEEVVE